MSLIRLQQLNTSELSVYVNSLFSGTFSELENGLDYALSSLSGVSGTVTTLSGRFDNLSGSVNLLSGYFNSLSDDFDALSGFVAGFSGAIQGNTNAITTLSGIVNIISGVAYANQSGLTTANNNISVISGKVNTLSGNVATSTGILHTKINTLSGLLPSGTVVGTTDPQTLENKTITASGNIIYSFNRKLAGGRLSLSSGVSVPTGNISGASTLYYTDHESNQISLYDGTDWRVREFSSDISLSLASLSANTNYDVFLEYSGGSFSLSTQVWSSDTSRGSNLTKLNGVYVQNGSPNLRYIGTIRTTSAGQCEDSSNKRFVFNAMNRVNRTLLRNESTGSWSYTTGAFRYANNNSANRVEFVNGLSDESVSASVLGFSTGNTATVYTGIGLDSSTSVFNQAGHTGGNSATAVYTGFLLGYHYLSWLEYGTTSTTFYGSAGNGGIYGLIRV